MKNVSGEMIDMGRRDTNVLGGEKEKKEGIGKRTVIRLSYYSLFTCSYLFNTDKHIYNF